MNRRFFVPLLGCLVPFANVLAVANGGCSCEHLDVCTQVNDIPIVFAARDMVRKTFLELGAKLIEKGSFTDHFAAPEGQPYSHVTAYYAEGRKLAQLSFSYPREDFDDIVKDYAAIGAIAEQAQHTGSLYSWRMADGAEMRVRLNKGTLVDFIAPAADAQLDVLLKPGYRSPIDRDAEARSARPASTTPLSITTSNPHQGVFEFHSEDAALLLGKRDLREEVCGSGDDFDWTTLDRQGLGEAQDKTLHIELQDDGSARVKLALHDDFGADIYRFLDVRPGKPTQAAVDGDCRRRKVSVVYTATHSPLCLVVNATNQESYDVVQKLVEVAAVHVDGTEVLPRKNSRVTFRDLELDAKDLLQLLGDVVEMEVLEKGPGHFEFRKPAKPSH